jgi:hypothetical protein
MVTAFDFTEIIVIFDLWKVTVEHEEIELKTERAGVCPAR